MPGARGDERLVHDVLQPDPPPPGQRMPDRDGQQHVLLHQHHRTQPGPAQRLRGDTEVHLTRRQLTSHHGGGRLVQTYLDSGVRGPEGREQRGERQQRLGGDRDPPLVPAHRVGHLAARVVQFAERPLDAAQEGRAVPVEADRAPLPVEEQHPQVGLQPGDRPAHRGLRDPQFGGGPADVLVPGHHLERPQGRQVHSGLPLRSSGRRRRAGSRPSRTRPGR